MATVPNRLERVPIRPDPNPLAAPASPHTPQRGISSTFSSPGNYRAEEDQVIFEFGARKFQGGFAGDSVPRVTLNLSAEDSRRVGDYRKWLPGFDDLPKSKRRLQDWGADHELWQLDLRDTDIGLVEDKVERIVREAYTKYLLIDARTRRVSIIVPSDVPHPFLSSILSILFNNFQIPSVTLLHPPTMAILAAGQRSGVIVDIGWHETVISVVYEFREVRQCRTRRAMKLVTIAMARLLQEVYEGRPEGSASSHGPGVGENEIMGIDFDVAEEAVTRMAWCKKFSNVADLKGLQGPHIAPDASDESEHVEHNDQETLIAIPGIPSASRACQVPFTSLSKPVETALFASSDNPREQDDHEQPIHFLLYNVLLALAPDIRSVCMSRIMFSGGGSNIPEVKFRILDELSDLVNHRGWDPVWRKTVDKRRHKLNANYDHRNKMSRVPAEKVSEDVDGFHKDKGVVGAAFTAQTHEPISEKLRHQDEKNSKPTIAGVIRGIETLGSWAGASLALSLRIKGTVEIEKDSFSQHGLVGVKRETDPAIAKARQNYMGGLTRTAGHDAATWSLGPWG